MDAAPARLPDDAVQGYATLAGYARQVAEAGPRQFKFQTYEAMLNFFLTIKFTEARRAMIQEQINATKPAEPLVVIPEVKG